MTGIQLGQDAVDTLTGFTGRVVGRFEYLYGCVRIEVERVGPDGLPQSHIFDEQRLTDTPSATSGGPRPNPTRPTP